MNILVTGGLGYIGSHLVLALLLEGHKVMMIDHRPCSWRVKNIAKLSGISPDVLIADINDGHLHQALDKAQIELVFHLAGLKSVPESILKPKDYYYHNLQGSLNLMKMVVDLEIPHLVFSSSSSVYAHVNHPLSEDSALLPQSPYGFAKQAMEKILSDLSLAHPNLHVAVLRYFNVAGAQESGLLGEKFLEEKNIFSGITRVLTHVDNYLQLHGDHFSTPDGFAVRDFIHVMDLVEAHLALLPKLSSLRYEVFNLGSGQGVSLLELIRCFESLSSCKIAYQIKDEGFANAGYSVAKNDKLKHALNWQVKRSLSDICQSHLHFVKQAGLHSWF